MKGLYIHIPFCLKKCKYCDFISYDNYPEMTAGYLLALERNMRRYKGSVCDTVFIGGGTPTALQKDELEFLMRIIGENFELTKDCEFTVEANPKTLDIKKLEVLKNGGVNRISVGVQSFVDSELLKIGRVHTAVEAEQTVQLIRSCGFDNISIDLMSALPGQNLESFKLSLNKAISLNPDHISCYSLILEEGTPLFLEYQNGILDLPDEEEERKMYELAVSELEKSGYLRYEISNFAKHGYESRHNKKYWRCEEYIGTGLSAHSYLFGERFSNTDSLSSYINGDLEKYNNEVLSKEESMSEYMFLGLRMTEGVSKTEFFEKFGIKMEKVFKNPLSKFIKMGMIEEDKDKIRLSGKAVSVSNQIMCEFIL